MLIRPCVRCLIACRRVRMWQIERRRVSAVDPSLHNAEISRRLGARWRRLSAAERRPFVDEADRLRVLHAREFPDYKYTPRKSRKKTQRPARRPQRTAAATTGRKWSPPDDVTQLLLFPVDAYDSEVSRYFAAAAAAAGDGRRGGGGGRRRASGGKRGRMAGAAAWRGGSGPAGDLPPTPDSAAAQYRADRLLFRAIAGDVPRTTAAAAAAAAAPKRPSRSRFEFPAVASPSDVRLGGGGGLWTPEVGGGGRDDDSDDAGALDTPISLELDAGAAASSTAAAAAARSLFADDRHDTPSFAVESAASAAAADPFCVDYCTPEVAAIVRDDWLETTIHNDALI